MSSHQKSSVDTIMSILANEHRRRLLVALLKRNPQDVDNSQVPVDVAIAESELEASLIQMKHVHLPKLEEGGFIMWDRDSNKISRGARFGEIRPLVKLMKEHTDELPDDWL